VAAEMWRRWGGGEAALMRQRSAVLRRCGGGAARAGHDGAARARHDGAARRCGTAPLVRPHRGAARRYGTEVMRQRRVGDAAMRRSGCEMVLRRSGIDPEAIGGVAPCCCAAAVQLRTTVRRSSPARHQRCGHGAAMQYGSDAAATLWRYCNAAAMLRCCSSVVQRAASMRQQCGECPPIFMPAPTAEKSTPLDLYFGLLIHFYTTNICNSILPAYFDTFAQSIIIPNHPSQSLSAHCNNHNRLSVQTNPSLSYSSH
jgi:hypothetical protein